MDKILIWILLYLSLTRVVPLLPSFPDFVYYGAFSGSFIWLVIRAGLHISGKFLPFLLAIFLSVWVNDIPAFFRTYFRIMAFLAIVLMVGPFVINQRLVKFRRLLLIRSLIFIRWIIVCSFVVWLIMPSLALGRGGFQGVTFHSMLIGPLRGLSLLYGLYRFYLAETTTIRCKEIGHVVISFLVVLLAGSRSALGGMILGGVMFYIRMYRHYVARLIKIAVALSLLLVVTSGLWWPYTERLRSKMESGEESGSLTSTRDGLWKDRMNEFYAYPFLGVGFASYNLDYVANLDHGIDIKTGTVEPGSGWLFLLSSMGLMGFLSFSIPVGYLFFTIYKNDNLGVNGSLICSLLVLLSAHLLFEGYAVSSGAYLCFFLWLLLAESEQVIQNNNKRLSV